jgi:putative transposase
MLLRGGGHGETITAASSSASNFQAELRFLGIASSPAFVRAPEGIGGVERFIRRLKEQIL